MQIFCKQHQRQLGYQYYCMYLYLSFYKHFNYLFVYKGTRTLWTIRNLSKLHDGFGLCRRTAMIMTMTVVLMRLMLFVLCLTAVVVVRIWEAKGRWIRNFINFKPKAHTYYDVPKRFLGDILEFYVDIYNNLKDSRTSTKWSTGWFSIVLEWKTILNSLWYILVTDSLYFLKWN